LLKLSGTSRLAVAPSAPLPGLATMAPSELEDGLQAAATSPVKPTMQTNGMVEDEDALVQKTVEAAKLQLPGSTLTEWQQAWCTKDKVLMYLRGRNLDVHKAAGLLARALEWRQANAEVLQGTRVPKWTGDMRVLAVSAAGNPLVYACMRNKGPSSPTDEVEHIAAVLEAAVHAMPPGVTQLDAVFDAHGFRIANFLDPRPVVALGTALRYAYRDILRTGIIVDAPRTFTVPWNVFAPLLPATTRDKIRFVSKSEAVQLAGSIAGDNVAEVLDSVMTGNRSAAGVQSPRLPSEVA